jgi:hypothetical protein
MILEGSGKEALPDITAGVFDNPEVDGGVIRGCVTVEEMKLLEAARHKNEEGLVSITVESIVPQFAEVYKQVRSWWNREGYRKFELSDYLCFTDYVPAGRGIAPHIDYYDNLSEFVQAGVSFSLSAGDINSGAMMKVARPKEADFRKDDGTIDIKALLGWQALVSSNMVQWEEVNLGFGDVFVLPQHNTPAGHAVNAP